MKKIAVVVMCACLCSCQRSCTSLKRDWQTSDRHYHVEQFSGGKLVHTYDFKGILNNQDSSDGFYWYSGDTLYEVSGDIAVISDK